MQTCCAVSGDGIGRGVNWLGDALGEVSAFHCASKVHVLDGLDFNLCLSSTFHYLFTAFPWPSTTFDSDHGLEYFARP